MRIEGENKMENTNEMRLVFESRPVNEWLARIAVAAFCTQLNPTLEEVADLKTAVSEAVTNCIIHGYEGEIREIEVKCRLSGKELFVDVTDSGKGIADIKKPWSHYLPLSRTRRDPVWDLRLWKPLWMSCLWNPVWEPGPLCIWKRP